MNDTIAAISTTMGVGAISIIRVSGPESLEIVNKIFKGKNLKEVESHTINYGYIKDNNEIIDAVVAFANTDGGDLYIGVEDDGEITGLHDKHKDATQLSAFIANKTVPPVSVRIEVIDAEYPILKISVPKKHLLFLLQVERCNADDLKRMDVQRMYQCSHHKGRLPCYLRRLGKLRHRYHLSIRLSFDSLQRLHLRQLCMARSKIFRSNNLALMKFLDHKCFLRLGDLV